MSALSTQMGYSIDRLYLSHSSRRLLHSCARKFEFRKMFKHPAKDRGLAAEMGKALHAGVQEFLISKDENKAIWKYIVNYPIDMCQNPMDKYSLEAGYNTLMTIINSTPLLEYELVTVNCHDGVIRPAIEVPFEITLDGFILSPSLPIPVSYCGYIDVIFYSKTTNEFVVLDIKTVGKIDQDLSPKYAFSEQCLPYALVLNYMQGKQINGFAIKYLVCRVDIMESSTQIHTFNKSQQDVEDWFRGLLVDLANLRMFVEMGWFPRDGGGDSCFSFNRRCLYYDLCESRDNNAIQEIIFQEGDKQKLEMAQVEQGENKTLKSEFDPWVKFGIPTPNLLGVAA